MTSGNTGGRMGKWDKEKKEAYKKYVIEQIIPVSDWGSKTPSCCGRHREHDHKHCPTWGGRSWCIHPSAPICWWLGGAPRDVNSSVCMVCPMQRQKQSLHRESQMLAEECLGQGVEWCVHSGDGQSTRSICYLRYVSGPVKDRNHTVILDMKNYYLWRITSKKEMKENAKE